MIHIKKLLSRSRIIFSLRRRYTFQKVNDFWNDIPQSVYYKPRVKVQDFLTGLGITYKKGENSFRIKQCPFCLKPHYNDLTNLFTLNISISSGHFICYRCNTKGSWNQFRARMLNQDNQNNGYYNQFINNPNNQTVQNTNIYSQISDVQYYFYINNLKLPQYADVLEYLHYRGFTNQTMQKYKIGVGTQTFISSLGTQVSVKVIYFPMYQPVQKNKNNQNKKTTSTTIAKPLGSSSPTASSFSTSSSLVSSSSTSSSISSSISSSFSSSKPPTDDNQPIQVKLVKVKIRGGSKQTKKYTRQYPSGPQTGFFGLNTILKNQNTIVITQGQFDAMAVNQSTGFPAISLPNGAYNLPDKVLTYLNKFTKIILWMDNDEAGRLGQQKISHKLGRSRTFIVKNINSQLKDANDYLKHCPQKMKQMIISSKNEITENIIQFTDVKQMVKNRIFKYQQYLGISIDWLTSFNKIVKGIRMQEVTVVSGPTGSGKTTFLSQISLNLCSKKIPVLWGSFQILNQVLISNMMIQFSGVNLMKNKQQFQYFSQKFQHLPLYLLSFHGTNDVQKVLSTIEFAIQVYNVSFVVLDTLQFMLSDFVDGSKKFDLQDKVMSRLRKIATTYKVHIAIVIHPRKTDENEDIRIHQIYGTSKATQQADNIWIVQKRQKFKILDIKKNRFDGQLGMIALGYDKQLKSFLQLTRKQFEQLQKKQITIHDIVQKRKKRQKQNQLQQFELKQQQINLQINEDYPPHKKKYHKK